MRATANVIADSASVKGFADFRRLFLAGIAAETLNLPCGGGVEAAELFRIGICPGVLFGASYRKIYRSGAGKQKMLVKGHFVGLVNVFRAVLAEPEGELNSHIRYFFGALMLDSF